MVHHLMRAAAVAFLLAALRAAPESVVDNGVRYALRCVLVSLGIGHLAFALVMALSVTLGRSKP